MGASGRRDDIQFEHVELAQDNVPLLLEDRRRQPRGLQLVNRLYRLFLPARAPSVSRHGLEEATGCQRDATYCSAPSNRSSKPARTMTMKPRPARISRKTPTLAATLATSAISAATSAASAASPTPRPCPMHMSESAACAFRIPIDRVLAHPREPWPPPRPRR